MLRMVTSSIVLEETSISGTSINIAGVTTAVGVGVYMQMLSSEKSLGVTSTRVT